MPLSSGVNSHTSASSHPNSHPFSHSLQACEALRRAKFKFPGRQKIIASRNWGFTPYVRDDFVQWRKEGRLQNDGVHARLITHR